MASFSGDFCKQIDINVYYTQNYIKYSRIHKDYLMKKNLNLS